LRDCGRFPTDQDATPGSNLIAFSADLIPTVGSRCRVLVRAFGKFEFETQQVRFVSSMSLLSLKRSMFSTPFKRRQHGRPRATSPLQHRDTEN
jgi:hypothetical protein